MEWFDVIILGVVQGITEFLPISSSGHLVLVREWLQLEADNTLAFDAILHFATTVAVIIYFRTDLWRLWQTVLRRLERLPVEPRDMLFIKAIAIGTIPAVVGGLLLESVVDSYAQSALVVAVTLFLASIFFLYAEWRYSVSPPHNELTVRRGWWIGCFQVLALLPGMSRAGSTIAGGMLLGLTRLEATRFSFILAIPITLGVGTKKMLDLLGEGAAVDWGLLMVGAGAACITAFLVIHLFLGFIRRYTLWPFVWYGIILAGLVGYGAWVG